MRFDKPLIEAKFLKRYKRFFADIELAGGQIVTAHLANTGSLRGVLNPNSPCHVTMSDDPKRKLKYSLQALKTPESWVGVNTMVPNQIVWEAWTEKKIPHWENYDVCKREFKLNTKTRLDFALFKNDQLSRLVEVKSVTMAEAGVAMFPDAVTARGLKHLEELINCQKTGLQTELIFIVQRTDCDSFKPARDIDPLYAEALSKAIQVGVEIRAYSVRFRDKGICLDASRPISLSC